jgi:hypothetical protein
VWGVIVFRLVAVHVDADAAGADVVELAVPHDASSTTQIKVAAENQSFARMGEKGTAIRGGERLWQSCSRRPAPALLN